MSEIKKIFKEFFSVLQAWNKSEKPPLSVLILFDVLYTSLFILIFHQMGEIMLAISMTIFSNQTQNITVLKTYNQQTYFHPEFLYFSFHGFSSMDFKLIRGRDKSMLLRTFPY